MAMINGTDFNGNNTLNGNGKFHKFLVGAIALLPLSLIGFSLGTVITAPALALGPAEPCMAIDGGSFCDGGGDIGGQDQGGNDGPKEPNDDADPPNQPKPKPKPPNQPKPKPPSQPKPDSSICNKKPDLPQCN
ncbi:hypothetical protein [Coleofasciculus sp. FACHB-129]|uniref:hypothetical protein n=1 Tax=Cyanophyceae TaxID=3028117 RepID=UPI0016851D46|nr:hypothetical protein [Coleofasciculus sp. FACHB-129]MBD1893146.1 hypothetical protein [Coleofasciculus sp. FACHB-129]